MTLPSLRRRMLWRLLAPLALVWGVGTGVATGVAYHFTGQALDRTLLDDALAISANVSAPAGVLHFELSPREVEAVLFDENERAFFAVRRPDGSLLAGQSGLGQAERESAADWTFDDSAGRGAALRRVTLWRSKPAEHVVVVARTVRVRTEFMRKLLVYSTVPQALLLVLLGVALRASVGRELGPLAALQQALDRRDSRELQPLDIVPQTRDLARLAAAIDALLARIADGVAAQREFAGNVAHELRTPLAGIRSLAEYGLRQRDAAAQRAQLQAILRSEERASHRIDQLLALARALEARAGLQLAPLAVDALVRDLLLRLMTRADALGVDLGAVGLDRPVFALADAALLEGALENLIDNALRYGRPAAAQALPTVTVEVQGGGAEAAISVTDNGPGMAEGELRRVHGRWAQGAAGERLALGTGLGLSIVARYVEQLGGRFELAAAPQGTGLRATIRLRAALPAPGGGAATIGA